MSNVVGRVPGGGPEGAADALVESAAFAGAALFVAGAVLASLGAADEAGAALLVVDP